MRKVVVGWCSIVSDWLDAGCGVSVFRDEAVKLFVGMVSSG